jgi:thioredoxin-dependent peroxiredoxin
MSQGSIKSDWRFMAKAPDFTLQSDENTPVSLSDFLGQRVLIFFFPKADTPGCTKQACGFHDAFPQITEQGAVVIGISPDSPKKLTKWKAKEQLPYILLSDPAHEVAQAFGVWGEKKFMGRLFDGVIRSHFVVDAQGNLEASEVNVSPEDSITKGIASLTQQ